MKYLISLLLLMPFIGEAQNKVNVEKAEYTSIDFYVAGSVPVVKAQYFRVVEGTPYFRDIWTEAILQSPQGKLYKMDKVKLDLVTNEISFIDKDGVERISTVEISAVQFNVPDTPVSCRFRKLAISQGNKKAEWFVEVIKDDRVSLYKRIVKQISESIPYGTSTMQQKIRDQYKFFIYINGSLLPVKSILDLPGLLPGKKNEMQTFISKLDKKKKGDENFRLAIEYYLMTTTPVRDM